MSNKRQRKSSPSIITSTSSKEIDLNVQAEEANLIYKSEALANQVNGRVGVVAGGRLQKHAGIREGSEEIWIDRYDILNLLDIVPAIHSPASPTHSAGFDDLPEEELFYFDLEERENISRIRKKKMMEEGRLERIRVREEEDRLAEEAMRLENEPSEDQLALMRKLHLTLSASPDPALLEMRILANHGVDPRFSFLRKGGKFRDAWEMIRKEAEIVKDQVLPVASGSGLVAYGSDSDDSDEEPEVEEEKVDIVIEEEVAVEIEESISLEESVEEKAKKEAKAEKAREWAKKRKAARGNI